MPVTRKQDGGSSAPRSSVQRASPVQEISVTFPHATKSHICVCGTTIAVRERYIRAVYRDLDATGNQFRCSRTHLACPQASEVQS